MIAPVSSTNLAPVSSTIAGMVHVTDGKIKVEITLPSAPATRRYVPVLSICMQVNCPTITEETSSESIKTAVDIFPGTVIMYLSTLNALVVTNNVTSSDFRTISFGLGDVSRTSSLSISTRNESAQNSILKEDYPHYRPFPGDWL